MSNKHHQSGMTLIELIVAIVIIAVGLAGVLSVFNTNVRASADPMVQKQLLAIAEGMLDEVMLLPYTAGTGTGTGCVREAFDDIGDFAAYNSQPICDLEGNTILSGYSVSVAVVDATLGMELTGETSKKITVTVQRNANESVSLISWRTGWAQ